MHKLSQQACHAAKSLCQTADLSTLQYARLKSLSAFWADNQHGNTYVLQENQFILYISFFEAHPRILFDLA